MGLVKQREIKGKTENLNETFAHLSTSYLFYDEESLLATFMLGKDWLIEN